MAFRACGLVLDRPESQGLREKVKSLFAAQITPLGVENNVDGGIHASRGVPEHGGGALHLKKGARPF